MDIYRDIILDHYKHPRNFGKLEKYDKTAHVANATCGDKIQMDILFGIDKKGHQIIEDIRFSGVGCAISQASASMLTEYVKGKTIDEIKNIRSNNVIEMVGGQLTPSRVKCATLPLEVLTSALVQ
jgi:nitrogen fixation protein NifU and related proteins